MTPEMLPICGGRREGLGLTGPPGERLMGRLPPRPPCQAGRTPGTGRPRDPDQTRTPGGNAPTTRGGAE